MFVRHPILTLPVHKRSSERYYRDHDRWVEKQRPKLEEEWHRPFDDIPPHIRIHWKDRWYWPPWYFNDVLGFVRLGTGAELELAGDVYLKRRHFPHEAPERLYRDQESVEEKEQILFLGSTPPQGVEEGRNETFVTAIEIVLKEAKRLVREFGRGTRTARLGLPEYGLHHIDLAGADREMRRKRAETN